MSNSRIPAGILEATEASGLFKGSLAFVAGFLAISSVGILAIAFLAMRSPDPLLMLVLALLSALGLFFLFGMLAGHVRITARASHADTTLAIAENLGEALQVTSRDGRILFANARMRELASGAGALRTVEQMFAGEPRAEEAIYRLTRKAVGGAGGSEEFEVSRVPGSLRPGWVRVFATPLVGALGGEAGEEFILWRVADVTAEHVRIAEALRLGDEILLSYDRLPAGLLIVQPGGRIAHLNKPLQSWLGLEADRGRPLEIRVSDILTPEAEALVASHAGPSVERFDLDFVGAGGRSFPAAAVVTVDGAGGWSAVVLHRSLAPSRDNEVGDTAAKRLFQSAPIGIATIDREGRVVAANSALARLLVVPAVRERAGLLDLLARDGEQRQAVDASLAAALDGKATIPQAEITNGPKGEFTRRVYMRPLPQGAGPEAVIVYVVDATEQRALEEKYAQSQKMEAIGKLAGGIAHDFNNVLTAIIGWSDILLGTQRPGDPAFQNIMNIKSSANRAAGLVNQLLAFSRRQTLQPEVLQLGEMLTEISMLINRLLGERIELKIHQGRDLWHVKADRTQLGQVMMNLAVNARDAMLNGGTLSIRTRNVTERDVRKLESQGAAIAAGEYVVIEVEDTGVGMEPQVLAKIFEPFFTTKGVGKGTGLGLSTVYGIVRQTGGYVLADSTPGKGTTFRVYLPRHVVEPDEDVATPKVARPAQSKDLTGRGRVLLVEDEDAVRSFAVEALKRQGYEVIEAASGAEAVELVAGLEGQIDIVVSDVIMPEMDGPTMMKELRKQRPDLKFIFVSGYPDDAFKNNLTPGDKFAFLPKPFSLAQLAAKVKDELAA